MGISTMRPETRPSNSPAPSHADALYMIRDSVRRRERLVFGALHAHGDSCAVGAFFDDNPKLALATATIDEVAAYNDSIPAHVSDRTRKRKVLEWLNFKLAVLSRKKR